MEYRYLVVLLITLFLFACDNSNNASTPNVIPLAEIGSLANAEELKKQLEQGMSQEQVEKILGIPDYSPIDGLYYYAAKNAQTLVVDYRNKKDEITKELQLFWLGAVGE